MLNFLKYLPLVGAFKDVSESYKEELGKERPAYLSRRFIGAVVALTGVVLSVFFGIKLDSTLLTQVTDNFEKLGSVLVALYGVILGIYGLLKKQPKEVK